MCHPSIFTKRYFSPQVSFKQNFNMGQVSQYPAGHAQSGYVDVQCFPLYSFLLALERTTIDYFSLDVEGAELAVLKTIPWSKVDIKVSTTGATWLASLFQKLVYNGIIYFDCRFSLWNSFMGQKGKMLYKTI